MVISSEAERIFLKLAEMYGKKTVPFDAVKGRTTVPKEYTGAWVLIERADRRLSIAEITGTQVTLRDLKFPLGAIAFQPIDFPAAVDMAMHAIREYMHVYPTTLPGARHEVPPGEIAKMPQVTINGVTYYRDDAMKEFRVVGHPEQRISFEDYEHKYFLRNRWIRGHFSGNVAIMQSSRAEAYQTTNQDNAMEALAFWILNGVLIPGAGPEKDPQRPGRGEGNWLEIEKVTGKINIADNHNQSLSTEDAQKALRAVRSWVYGGQLKG